MKQQRQRKRRLFTCAVSQNYEREGWHCPSFWNVRVWDNFLGTLKSLGFHVNRNVMLNIFCNALQTDLSYEIPDSWWSKRCRPGAGLLQGQGYMITRLLRILAEVGLQERRFTHPQHLSCAQVEELYQMHLIHQASQTQKGTHTYSPIWGSPRAASRQACGSIEPRFNCPGFRPSSTYRKTGGQWWIWVTGKVQESWVGLRMLTAKDDLLANPQELWLLLPVQRESLDPIGRGCPTAMLWLEVQNHQQKPLCGMSNEICRIHTKK